MAKVFLILGSDLGDKTRHLHEAILLIEKQTGKITDRSHVYETEPWGFDHEEYFLNQVVCIDTMLKPADLLSQVQQIENALGRVRGEKRYMPRTIDIDILIYDHLIINLPELIIPHPEISKRRFVLEPLAEIASQWEHPLTRKTISQLLADCPDTNKVIRTDSK